MSLVISNVGKAAFVDRATGVMKAPLTKVDSIQLDVDAKVTEVRGGTSMYPVINISADRTSKVTLQGIEAPYAAIAGILGGNLTVAATGTKVQVPMVEELTITAGAVTLSKPISATTTSVTVIGALDGTLYTGVASAPTTGEYITPSASASSITFNTSDNGKNVIIYYTYDSTTGGQIDVLASSMPGEYKFVSNALLKNTEDGSNAEIAFIVNRCQLNGNWQLSQERQKASTPQLAMTILDPGGSTPAISIIPTAKFAG